MPLHDWSDPAGWDGVHLLWIAELLHWIKPRLPEGYRAYVGSAPALTVGAPAERPDVSVRDWRPEPPPEPPAPDAGGLTPDEEVAIAVLQTDPGLFVSRAGRLVAAVELISPRNKDRPASRAAYLGRYLGYLQEGVHLLVVDVHRRPLAFSFADALAQEFQMTRPPLPPPMAVAYRVGEPAATGGKIVGFWRRSLEVGAPLPAMPLPLGLRAHVEVDLEATYAKAAAAAYLT